jgi:subtilisin family serine protease
MKLNQRGGRQNKRRCFLPPYKIEKTLSVQQAGDQPGWQITAFNLPKAWEHTQGEGVTVAVLDSGCDLDHPDIAENLVVPKGANIINPKKPPKDDNSHGSHCCGIICAPKNGVGIIGVAPKCKVMPIKVLDAQGNGDMLNVAKGIRFAMLNGADIISMSLGAPFPIQNVRKAIQAAARNSVPTFCAAGNAGLTKAIYYPARYPETIAIGSIDKNFRRSSFSNTGKNLDFMAPGSKILSTIPDDWYGLMSGTSMACPFAVGVAALLLSFARQNKPKLKLQSVNDFRKIIKKHTVSIKNGEMSGDKFYQGFGIISPESLFKKKK